MASRGLGTLTLDLVAKIGGFTGPLEKAERDALKRTKAIEAGFKKMGTAIGLAFTAAAGAAVVGIKGAVDRMDELSKSAARVQMPTEEFSKLAYAGELADVTIQDLQSSLGRLAKAQAAALKDTSEQARVFDALGISVKNADGSLRDTSDVLMDFADAFKSVGDSPEIMAAGMALFGRSFQNIIPLIKDGSQGLREAGDEAERLGLVLSTEAGQQAEQFNDDITRLTSSVGGLWRTVASELLPDLIRLTEQMAAWAKEADGAGKVADALGVAFKGASVVIEAFGSVLDFIGDRIEGATTATIGLVEAVKGLAGMDLSQIKAGFNVWKEGAGLALLGNDPRASAPSANTAPATPYELPASMMRPLMDASATRSRLRSALGGGGSKRTKSAGKSDAEREAEALLRSYESLNGSLKQQVALFGQTSEEARIRYETEFGSLANLTPLQKESLLVQAQKLDQLRDEAEVQKELDAVNKRREESAAQVIDDLNAEIEGLGKSAEWHEIRNNLLWAGVTAESALGQQIIATTQELQRQREAMEPQIKVMDALREGFQDTFVDVLSGAKSAKDALKDMFDMIHREILRVMAQNLSKALFGGQGSAAGGSAGNFFGNLIGGLFGGGKATGGGVQAGMFYRVNENGPEMLSIGGRDFLMMGSQSGHVTAKPRLGGGISQTFVVQGVPDRRTMEQMARDSGREAARAMSRTGR